MQILIDTDNMPTDELAAAINMLDDILTLRRKPSPAAENTEARADVQRVIDSLGTPEAPAAVPLAPMPPAAPPPPATIPAPPAVMLTQNATGDDIEVETDEAGNVTALTTPVQLPAAPPAPPAPVAAAPSAGIPAATPLPPGPAVAAELDSRGYPWDGRMHASNRSKTIKQEWKLKRGVDKNLVVAYEAQNKPGNAPSPATAPTAVAAATTAAPVPSVPTAASTASAVPPPPPSTVGNAAPAAVAPLPPAPPVDFRGLMQKIQAATAAKKLTDTQVNEALLTVGLQPTDMAQLIGNALYIASVNAAIDACLAS